MPRIFVLLLLLVLTAHGVVKASPVVIGTYEPTSEGFLLQFTVHNTLPDELLTLWYIRTADAYDLVAPQGWDVWQNFREVTWRYQEPFDQIKPGLSVGGFGFTAENLASEYSWHISSNQWGYSGTVTPTLIPEPGSLVVLAGGLAGMAGVIFRRRSS